MTYQTYSFASASGEFTGVTFTGSAEALEINTPAGCIAVPGAHDRLCRRYDAEAADVVAWQPPAPSDTTLTAWSWDADAERWQPVPTLASHQAAAWARIKAARADAETAPITVGLYTFDADDSSQQRIAGAVQMASLAVAAGQGADFSISWTLADNTTATLSATEIIAVGLSLGQQISAAHARSRVLRAQIDAATSAEELNLINWI